MKSYYQPHKHIWDECTQDSKKCPSIEIRFLGTSRTLRIRQVSRILPLTGREKRFPIKGRPLHRPEATIFIHFRRSGQVLAIHP